MFCLRARVHDASDYQWGVRQSTGKKFASRNRAWFTRIISPGWHDQITRVMIKITRYVKYDDVMRDSMINFMLTWHKLSFRIGNFEFEV
jgi:hypothetical protein